MTTKEIYNILDKERRLNYDSKQAFATSLGMSLQRYCQYMDRLLNNKKNHLKSTLNILDKAGYEIIIKKKS